MIDVNRPSTKDLPNSPEGKLGWPWNDEGEKLPYSTNYGKSIPKISIITTSFNQGKYLEETIRSIILQGYPNLEYIVIDGFSTDNSVDIIQKYETWITYWESKRDRGQAHALNKGFSISSGDILGWINSDDLLLPGALKRISSAHLANQESIILGDVILFSELIDFDQVLNQTGITFENMVQDWNSNIRWSQPGTFIPYSLYNVIGGFDESLRYLFDRDWMCRLLQIAGVNYLNVPIAKFRMHQTSKTVAEAPEWLQEHVLVTERYADHIQKFNKSLARAKIETWYGALPYLSVTRYHYNRRKGLIHLFRACEYDWRVFFWNRFILLLAVAVTPLKVLKLIRKYFKL